MYNKTVLITGAAKRIGAGIARYLHANGMNMIIHYNHSKKEAHRLVQELNDVRHDSTIAIQSDLEYKEHYLTLLKAATAFKGTIDVLINNASTFFPTLINNMDEEQWNKLININLKAPLFLSQLAAPILNKNKGCIINMIDIHANRPLKQHTIYSISKTGLLMLTQSLAKELGPNIRVNGVSPGAIIWPEHIDDPAKQKIINQTMLKRIGQIDDIAKAVMYLIRDADYVTGQIINVDGGRLLYS